MHRTLTHLASSLALAAVLTSPAAAQDMKAALLDDFDRMTHFLVSGAPCIGQTY